MTNTISKYPHVFEPITIAGTVFKNRIFCAPTGFIDVDKEGTYLGDAVSYYERKAMGGAATVTLGEMNISAKGAGNGYCVKLDNMYGLEQFNSHSIRKVAEAVNRYGAVCSGELIHAGMFAGRWQDPPAQAYGPVETDCDDGRHILEMPEEMIWDIVKDFAHGAKVLKECGFGMVLVHAGHGWLLHQFLSPKINTRKDKWGGPLPENRARFTIEVLKAIRSEVGPGFPIEVRISGSEAYDGGFGIEDGIETAKQLDGYADIIHVSAGSHEVEEVFTVTHPIMFNESGCNVKYAAEIKKHVKKSLVAAVGAIDSPELMENIIASGKADIVEVARGLIADPDMPMKLMTGRDKEVRRCLRCLACFSNVVRTGTFRCAVNPEIGSEYETKFNRHADVRKKVLVAGGGVGGMQAAITCARRGHEVTLVEKSGRLGGVLLCEEDVPFKHLVKRYLEQQAEIVEKLGVRIMLNTEATPELAAEIGPDVIIAAFGAAPKKPGIPGADRANVYAAEDAYKIPDKLGQKIVVMGSGLVGLEFAIYMGMLGRDVTVVHRIGKLNDGGNFQYMKGLKVQLEKYVKEIHHYMTPESIDDAGLNCRSKEGLEIHFDADSVVYATGMIPRTEETFALAGCGAEFYPVGDCLGAKDIMNASGMAYAAANAAGRL